MDDKVLFVGNGVNLDYSWDKLMQSLVDKFVDRKDLNTKSYPSFPLLYENVFLWSPLKDKIIRQYIADQMSVLLKKNDVHDMISSYNFRDIITTNYEYCLENALLERGAVRIKEEEIQDLQKYSLFRRIDIGETSIWHMHGECDYQKTILLGYVPYCKYLQLVRNYIRGNELGEEYNGKRFSEMGQKLQQGKLIQESWVDLLFTRDVHIVGYKLDYVEMHLWWLLTYRARKIKEEKKWKEYSNNNLYYYIPEYLEDENKEKLNLLDSCGVEVKVVNAKVNDLKYYKEVLDIVSKS